MMATICQLHILEYSTFIGLPCTFSHPQACRGTKEHDVTQKPTQASLYGGVGDSEHDAVGLHVAIPAQHSWPQCIVAKRLSRSGYRLGW